MLRVMQNIACAIHGLFLLQTANPHSQQANAPGDSDVVTRQLDAAAKADAASIWQDLMAASYEIFWRGQLRGSRMLVSHNVDGTSAQESLPEL